MMKKAARGVNGETKFIGIFGWPLTYSLSPVFQNAALRKKKLNAVYLPFPVEAGNFGALIKSLKKVPAFLGGNVTNPHKVAALKVADKLSPQAKAIGAVNTLYRRAGILIGHNTDAEGFIRALKLKGVELKRKRVLLLGAGGSARALAYAVLLAGASSLTVSSRREHQAALLVRRFRKMGACRALKLERAKLAALLSQADIIINTVPDRGFAVGVAKALKAQASRKVIFDISYGMKDNPLLEAAKIRHRGFDGMGMLLAQGALSRKLWIG